MQIKVENVGVVLITFNPSIKNLQRKIKQIIQRKIQVVIVNNGQKLNLTDNAYLKVIDLLQNKGIAFAQNAGVNWLHEMKYKYVFFFDQDSEFEDTYFDDMLRFWNEISLKNANLGVLSPNLFDRNRNENISINRINDGEVSRIYPEKNKKQFINNTLPISSGILTTVEIFNSIHGNNEKMFIDWVDFDFDLRILEAGYDIFTVSQVCLYHAIGKATRHNFLGHSLFPSNHAPFREFYYFRNGIFLYRHKKEKFPEIKKMIRNALIVRLVYCLYEKNKIKRVTNISQGIVAGIMNRI